MNTPIYIVFDVDCEITVLNKEPTKEDVVGSFDVRFIKVEDGVVYGSIFDYDGEGSWEWVLISPKSEDSNDYGRNGNSWIAYS